MIGCFDPVLNCAVCRFSGGKVSKVPDKQSPWREKTSSFGSNSPVKKQAKKTNSMENMQKEKVEVVQKQRSEPATLSNSKVRRWSFSPEHCVDSRMETAEVIGYTHYSNKEILNGRLSKAENTCSSCLHRHTYLLDNLASLFTQTHSTV